ncbi:MAG: hypothetical protein ABH812_02935 [bacterium]
MKKQILKVGFDLDGVLLYNPTRIARPLIVLIKKIFFNKEVDKFHIPKTKMQQLIWSLLHKSSMFVSPGYAEIKKLVKCKKIEAYIVTARYEFLKKDFEKWVIKMEANKYFKGMFINNKDEQPYEFKKRLIRNLGLNIFIEDNWDIVKKISIKNNGVKVFWITNLFDIRKKYKYKFYNLQKAVEKLGQFQE